MTALAANIANPTVILSPEAPSDRVAIEALVLAAFGPGRYAKTAERLRERAELVAGFVAREGARVIGSVRLWKVTVGATPALFLGPIAVDARSRRGGLGADLVVACIAEARRLQTGGVLLVGDVAYFQRFGFLPAPDANLPGPADPRRIMWLPITEPLGSGPVRPVH